MDNPFATLPNTDDSIDWVEATVYFGAMCPVPSPPKPYFGRAVVTYWPACHLLEFDSFQKWVGTLGTFPPMTLEALTATICRTVHKLLHPRMVEVECVVTSFDHIPARCSARREDANC